MTGPALDREVRHAQVALGIARALGDRGGVGHLEVSGAVDSHPATVRRGTILGGCVGEALAAACAAAAGTQAVSQALAATLDRIATDETRCAALAWKSERWLLAGHPSLAVQRAGGAGTVSVRGWGCLTPADEQTLVEDVRAQVVRPCARALLTVQQRAAA